MRRIATLFFAVLMVGLLVQACSQDRNPVTSEKQTTTERNVGNTADAATCLGVIGDFVWNDVNMDGVQDVNEPGLEGIEVILHTCWSEDPPRTTYTDANGYYSFDVECGHYSVEFVAPPGYSYSPLNVNMPPNTRYNLDSDAQLDPWNLGMTRCFTITWDGFQDDPTWDCGLYTDDPPPPPPGGDCDDGRPMVLTMQYTGDGCDGSDNNQSSSSVVCTGDPNDASPVRILISSREDLGHRNTVIWFDGMVNLGQNFDVDARDEGTNRLSPNTYVRVYNQTGQMIHYVKFHTSCSQPLATGDQFGTILITGFVPRP